MVTSSKVKVKTDVHVSPAPRASGLSARVGHRSLALAVLSPGPESQNEAAKALSVLIARRRGYETRQSMPVSGLSSARLLTLPKVGTSCVHRDALSRTNRQLRLMGSFPLTTASTGTGLPYVLVPRFLLGKGRLTGRLGRPP